MDAKNFIIIIVIILSIFFGCYLKTAYAASKPYKFIEKDGLKRSYFVHVPNTYKKTKRVPLVVVLHGAIANARSMEQTSGMSLKSDQKGFMLHIRMVQE